LLGVRDRECVRVRVRVTDTLAERLMVRDRVGVRELLAVRLRLRVTLGVDDRLLLVDGVSDVLFVSDGDLVSERVTDTVGVSDLVGVRESELNLLLVTVRDGVRLRDGVLDAVRDRLAGDGVALGLGVRDGECVTRRHSMWTSTRANDAPRLLDTSSFSRWVTVAPSDSSACGTVTSRATSVVAALDSVAYHVGTLGNSVTCDAPKSSPEATTSSPSVTV
jgi:hypothetical protein